MSSGLSVMVLISLIIKTLMTGDINNVTAIIAIAGATLGFYLYERYPSVSSGKHRIAHGRLCDWRHDSHERVHIQRFYYAAAAHHQFPDVRLLEGQKVPQVKFGKVRDDGTLEVPNNLTLKWVLPYYTNVTENRQHMPCMLSLRCSVSSGY